MRETRYYAACNLGLEEVTAGQLIGLGGRKVRSQRGGVQFSGDKRLGYAACLWLRSAVRVQEVLAEGAVRDKSELRGFIDGVEEVFADEPCFGTTAGCTDTYPRE